LPSVKQPDWRQPEYLPEQDEGLPPPVRELQVASQLLHEPAAQAGANAAETAKLDTAIERTMAIIFICFSSSEKAALNLDAT
jgi:hypothetical protein